MGKDYQQVIMKPRFCEIIYYFIITVAALIISIDYQAKMCTYSY